MLRFCINNEIQTSLKFQKLQCHCSWVGTILGFDLSRSFGFVVHKKFELFKRNAFLFILKTFHNRLMNNVLKNLQVIPYEFSYQKMKNSDLNPVLIFIRETAH